MKHNNFIARRLIEHKYLEINSTNFNIANDMTIELIITTIINHKCSKFKALILTYSIDETISLIQRKIKHLNVDSIIEKSIIVKDINEFKEELIKSILEYPNGKKEEFETEFNHDYLESFIYENHVQLIYYPHNELLQTDKDLINMFCINSCILILTTLIFDPLCLANLYKTYDLDKGIETFCFLNEKNDLITIKLFEDCSLIIS